MSDGVLMVVLGAALAIFGVWFLILVLMVAAVYCFWKNVWKNTRR